MTRIITCKDYYHLQAYHYETLTALNGMDDACCQ